MTTMQRPLLAAGGACLASGGARTVEERRIDSAGVPIRFIEAGRDEPVAACAAIDFLRTNRMG